MSKEKQVMTFKNKKEVEEKAKELGISLYHKGKRLPKSALEEMIAEVLNNVDDSPVDDSPKDNDPNWVDVEVEVVDHIDDGEQADTSGSEEKDSAKDADDGLTPEERQERHIKFVEGAKVGTLVAFKVGPNKAKSAKIIKRSTKNRKFKVETAYGKEFIISFDDVIWVLTNKRWPKGVYNMLKGKVEKDEGTAEES